MELKEFKERLEKQGVSYELFCERYNREPLVHEFIRDHTGFPPVINNAFRWTSTPEGMSYWEDVYYEQRVTPTTRELNYDASLPPKGMSKEEFFTFFEETTARMIKISRAKNSDYTGSVDDDPFANFTRVESLGICSTETGFLTRMTDKLSRIASFVKQGTLEVKDESVEDTLLDLANYSILMLGYLKSKKT